MDYQSLMLMVEESRKDKEKVKQQVKKKGYGRIQKNYTVELYVKQYDRQGNTSTVLGKLEEDKPAVWKEGSFGAAQRKADRMLVDRQDSLYCLISNTKGNPVITEIPRGDAIARVLMVRNRMVVRTPAKSRPLKWYAKAKNDRVIGPWSNR